MNLSYTFRNPAFLNPKTGHPMPNGSEWQTRHMQALRAPRGFENAIVHMISAWARYADEHRFAYETPIGNDAVIGEAWHDMARAILALLNGATGRLDCGTLDGFIRDTMASEGVDCV